MSAKKQNLERGGFAIRGRGSQGMGMVNNLVDGINRFAFAGTATDVEDPGNELVVNVVAIAGNLERTFPATDERWNANGFSTMTTQHSAKTFRHNRRCHEKDSLGLTAD